MRHGERSQTRTRSVTRPPHLVHQQTSRPRLPSADRSRPQLIWQRAKPKQKITAEIPTRKPLPSLLKPTESNTPAASPVSRRLLTNGSHESSRVNAREHCRLKSPHGHPRRSAAGTRGTPLSPSNS